MNFQPDKGHLPKTPSTDIIIDAENLHTLPLTLRTKQEPPLSDLPFLSCTGHPGQCNKTRKQTEETESIRFERKKQFSILYVGDRRKSTENPQKGTRSNR